MKRSLLGKFLILLAIFSLLISFQNCNKFLTTQNLGGGEPYPGAPASHEGGGEPYPGDVSGPQGVYFQSLNKACADKLASDIITINAAGDGFIQAREDCLMQNKTIPSSSLNWTKPDIEFIYNNKVYKINTL